MAQRAHRTTGSPMAIILVALALMSLEGCVPAYAEMTGGLHSIGGEEVDATFMPSLGIGFGIPFYFDPLDFSIGAGIDMMVADLPQGELTVYSGGLILDFGWHFGATTISDRGFVLYAADVYYGGTGTTKLDDGEKVGSANGLMLGATAGWVGPSAGLLATLGPHLLFASHPQLGSLFAFGGQLRLRLLYGVGHGGGL